MNRGIGLMVAAIPCCAIIVSSTQYAAGAPAPKDAIAHEQSFNKIQGTINFSDDGTTLTVNGHATGMTPGLAYVSFIYGTGSFSRGTLACLPPSPNNLNATQMTLGSWLPVDSPVRTLQAAKSGGSYAPLTSFATASIRYDSNSAAAAVAPTPARYWLQTCGRVVTGDPTDFQATAAEGDDGS